VLEMGPGNSSFQIYFPISPNNIISWINLIVSFNLSNAIMFPT
jgi:hypothetical protein